MDEKEAEARPIMGTIFLVINEVWIWEDPEEKRLQTVMLLTIKYIDTCIGFET